MYCRDELNRFGINMADTDVALYVALKNYKPIDGVKGNWDCVSRDWCEPLTWQRPQRLASLEDSTAERRVPDL